MPFSHRMDAAADPDVELAEFVGQFYADPLGFVLACYPWGEPGPLEHEAGPDTWQRDFLIRIGEKVKANGFNGVDAVLPIREAVSSGHGVGKSALTAWMVNWIASTRPYSQGTVTANSYSQLKTKTWAAVQTWTKRCLTGHWFVVNSDMLYQRDHKSDWFCALQSSKKENSEAFAGQHAKTSTSYYFFDEASGIEESGHGSDENDVFTVAEGGLTDGEPMIFLFGNCTRSHGKFHRVCFGSERERWTQTIIDSEKCRFSNKALIKEWIADHGEDSDFVRVRVRGLPPRASDMQFIASDLVTDAQKRPVVRFGDEPLLVGLDVSRGGEDCTVFRFRRGMDARSIPAIRISGEKSRDSMNVVSQAARILEEYPVQTMFIDGTGIGGPICDRLRQLGHRNVIEVQFGAESPDLKCKNMRSHMWNKTRDWLKIGAIDASPILEMDLTGPGYSHKGPLDQLLLESKESMKARGLASPDDGDALALTFALAVRPKPKPAQGPRPVSGEAGWMA